MPRLPGISNLRAVIAFKKAGFRITREGKHTTMTDGERIITVPRADPINSYTMAGIVRDAGLNIDEFKNFSKIEGMPGPIIYSFLARRIFIGRARSRRLS